jgi:hypothetical protein
MVLDLTSFDQIRGVLTVSQADLPDETLTAYALEDDLTVDLDSWVSGWATVVDVAQARLLRLYAKYFCAGTVAATAPVFVLTKMSDGSNEGQRSNAEGFLWLSESMLKKAAGYKAKLLVAQGGQIDPAAAYTLISRVTPDRDPVVEPRSAS